MTICVTGSTGLIGSSVCNLLLKHHTIVGIDNNMRRKFFGRQGSTLSQKILLTSHPNYLHKNIDIRNKTAINTLFQTTRFDAVIHCAAQPSHDRARDIIRLDFEVNTTGTINLLEATRNNNPSAAFIFMSTNKVYGDNPNLIPLVEEKTRYSFKNPKFKGFDETCSIDYCTHSFFGASKLAADVYVQEYGRYYGLKTTVLRLGCVTGAHHAGVKLHGFLSFLIKSLVHSNSYEVIGYGGKQVRDQIHADDVASAAAAILEKPNTGDVYNLGGGYENSASILELVAMIANKLHTRPKISFIETPRFGDHICYITNYSKFQKVYPSWNISRSLERIVDELIAYEKTNCNIRKRDAS